MSSLDSNSCSCCKKRPQKLRRCSKCKSVFYCSIDCQKKDWVAKHREECGNAPEEGQMIKTAFGVLRASDVIADSPRSGFVKFPLPPLGRQILKAAVENGVVVETKGQDVFVNVILNSELADDVDDAIMKQIENLRRLGRYWEMLESAVDYEAVVRFYFDVLQREEESSSADSTVASASIEPRPPVSERRLSTLASLLVNAYLLLATLPHAFRDFRLSLDYALKGLDFLRRLDASFPAVAPQVAPAMERLERLTATTRECAIPSSEMAALTGDADALTIDDRLDRAASGGDDERLLKSLRLATLYFAALGDFIGATRYASRFVEEAKKRHFTASKDGVEFERRKSIAALYADAMKIYAEEVTSRSTSHSAGDEALDLASRVFEIGEAFDLQNVALEASTRLSTWLLRGRVARHRPLKAAEVAADPEEAREFAAKALTSLSKMGRCVEDSCSICLEPFDWLTEDFEKAPPIRILPFCYHVFHDECISGVNLNLADEHENTIKCPVCKNVTKDL